MVENALGRSKGRWRCLLKRNNFYLSNIILIASACAVLHNLCEMFINECLVKWTTKDEAPSSDSISSAPVSSSASAIHDAIATHLYESQHSHQQKI